MLICFFPVPSSVWLMLQEPQELHEAQLQTLVLHHHPTRLSRLDSPRIRSCAQLDSRIPRASKQVPKMVGKKSGKALLREEGKHN
jgi:hypothetical protein